MNKTLTLAAALAAVTAFTGGIAFAGTGVYTAAQATQGATVYSGKCAACHGANLEGGAGPALDGAKFKQMASAQSMTADSLLTVISTKMPLTAPHSLSASDYADVTAYILQKNGRSYCFS